MANPQHYDLVRKQASAVRKWKAENPSLPLIALEDDYELTRQVFAWNVWRFDNPDIIPDLSHANLMGEDLEGANFCKTNLHEAYLGEANLREANFRGADLSGATLAKANFQSANFEGADLTGAKFNERIIQGNTYGGGNLARMQLQKTKLRTYLYGADLYGSDLSDADLHGGTLTTANFCTANLTRANLSGAQLYGVNFTWANLTEANLKGADMRNCQLVETKLRNADISDCKVYGVSAWNVDLEGTNQSNLVITRGDEPVITVDNLEVAQFIYLLLNNRSIRRVIDTIAKKAVLILGRFTPTRKAVLDAIRDELRKHDYLPILFDFDLPKDRDVTETVTLLARLSRFIIADLTEPSSIPKELEAIIPTLAVPVQPLIEGASRPYAMFSDYWKYDWVLELARYSSLDDLIGSFTDKVIVPTEAKLEDLRKKRPH